MRYQYVRIGEFATATAEPETEFVLPEDLATIEEDAELETLESQAIEAYDGLRNTSPLSDDDLARLAGLATAIADIRAEAARRYEVAGQAESQASELDQLVHPTEPEAHTEAEEANDGETTDPPEGGDAGDPPAGDAGESGEAPAEEREPQLVASGRRGATRIPIGDITRRAPRPSVDAPAGAVITAAADLPGVSTGATIDMDTVARAMNDKAARLNNHSGEVPIARFEYSVPGPRLGSKTSDQVVEETVAQASDPKVLVASGGWCAPSAPIFDLFSIEGTDGLLDVPTVNIDRGGVKVPVSPSIADVTGDVWGWTETQDIASSPGGTPTKPCYHVPCTTWNDVRLGADGICVTAGNLQDRAFPEMTKRFIGLVTAQHLHVMSAKRIAAMAVGSTAVTMPVNTATTEAGALSPFLNALELQAIDYRSKYKMSPDAVLEAVIPHWVLGAWRADLGYRFGADADDFQVADALIAQYFAVRKVSPQFVLDWQINGAYNAAGSAVQVVGIGSTAAATAYPATVNFLIYAAGTWVAGTGGTLDLGVIRDSALNATNDFTAAWTEDFWLIFKKGHESRNVAVNMVPTGGTATTVAITAV